MTSPQIIESGQYLTFKLDEEEFALDILQVREVLDYTAITKVPKTPDFMRGVINLRGSVVPVIDLRLKLGLEEAERTIDTCIIIVEILLDGQNLVIGALADSVQEVIELDAGQIEPAPQMGTRLNTEFIKGMGRRDEKFIILLNIEKVFSTEELAIVQELSPEAEVEA